MPGWRELLRAEPEVAEAWGNLGDALFALDRYAEAEAAFAEAVQRRPAAAWSHRRLAVFLHQTGRWAEAREPYERALALAPADAFLHFDYGMLRLGLGDYEAAWPHYEWRKGLAGVSADPPPLRNEWQGEPLAGKSLLIWPEQGFGDLIQFARFAPMVAGLGADVTFVVRPELQALFESLGVRILPLARQLTFPVPDFWTMALSLPYRLGVTLATLPSAPYLQAPPARRDRWRGRIAPRTVAVAWRGRPSHPNDARRSLPADALSPLVAAHGLTPLDLSDPANQGEDFADAAAILEQAELVITVDTAIAHLAGALGRPCWVLLPWRRQDWRWMKGRTDSPWYSSVRLFRQPDHGDWSSVLADVDAALAAWREDHRHASPP